MENIYESKKDSAMNPLRVNLAEADGSLSTFYIANEHGKRQLSFTELVEEYVHYIKNNQSKWNLSDISIDEGARMGACSDYTHIGSSGNNAKIASSGNRNIIGSGAMILSTRDLSQMGRLGTDAQIGSCGNYAIIGSSGKNAKIGSSGDYSLIESSGVSAQIVSSGNDSLIGINGDFAKAGSSGEKAQIVVAGDSAKIGSGGFRAKIGSSGYESQIGSSGDESKIESKGSCARIGSSGNNAIIESSGDYARIANSGYYDMIGNRGKEARIGSCGDYAYIGSHGYRGRIGSSGNESQIEVKGNNSVCFACGANAVIRAKTGTWISLCEWGMDKKKNYIPLYATSAQIGNGNYKDCNGDMLNEKNHYILKGKKFVPLILDNGLMLQILQTKTVDDIEILKCRELENEKETQCIRRDGLSAQGETLRDAMEELEIKKLKMKVQSELVLQIKRCGTISKTEYRAVTGASKLGIEEISIELGYTTMEKVGLPELLKKLKTCHEGAFEFKKLFDLK